VLIANPAQASQEFSRRDDEAGLALHRLGDDGRYFGGRNDSLKQGVELVQALDVAGLGPASHRTAIAVSVVAKVDAG
jgi:hypothetical protein